MKLFFFLLISILLCCLATGSPTSIDDSDSPMRLYMLDFPPNLSKLRIMYKLLTGETDVPDDSYIFTRKVLAVTMEKGEAFFLEKVKEAGVSLSFTMVPRLLEAVRGERRRKYLKENGLDKKSIGMGGLWTDCSMLPMSEGLFASSLDDYKRSLDSKRREVDVAASINDDFDYTPPVRSIPVASSSSSVASSASSGASSSTASSVASSATASSGASSSTPTSSVSTAPVSAAPSISTPTDLAASLSSLTLVSTPSTLAPKEVKRTDSKGI